MYVLVLKLDHPNKSYRLSKIAAKRLTTEKWCVYTYWIQLNGAIRSFNFNILHTMEGEYGGVCSNGGHILTWRDPCNIHWTLSPTCPIQSLPLVCECMRMFVRVCDIVLYTLVRSVAVMSIKTFFVSREIRVWSPVQCSQHTHNTHATLTINNRGHWQNHSVLVIDNWINRFVSYDGKVVT